MDFIDYREKLGIGFCNDEKFVYFKNRLFNRLEEPTKVPKSVSLIPPKDYRAFCELVGVSIDYYILDANQTHDLKRFQHCLKTLREHSDNCLDFLSYYVSFVNSIGIRQMMTSIYNRKHYADILINSLDAAHIQYELLMNNDEYFIFPKGVPAFDDALVSQPLEWLTNYPQARKTFCVALRQYSDGVFIRDVADNLRKALEEFLREFLKNNCDLNKNKKEIEAYLKAKNADPQLINMLGSLITHYYLLNNEIAKHTDKVDSKYLEFLLYQTGIFIRMLIVVKQSTQEESADAD